MTGKQINLRLLNGDRSGINRFVPVFENAAIKIFGRIDKPTNAIFTKMAVISPHHHIKIRTQYPCLWPGSGLSGRIEKQAIFLQIAAIPAIDIAAVAAAMQRVIIKEFELLS